MDSAIEVKNLSKFKRGIKVLRDVSLTFPYGKTIGILGDSNSGKTLIMNILSGMDKRYEGGLYVDGRKWSHTSKAVMAFLADSFMFECPYRIDQLVDIYGDMFDDFNALTFEGFLKTLSLGKHAKINTLSIPDKRKLQLSFILSRDTPIYLFCEPRGGYDPLTRNTLMTFILKHKNPETTMILTTSHDDPIIKVLDECVFMKNGEAVIHDAISTLKLKHGSLEAAYEELVLYDKLETD